MPKKTWTVKLDDKTYSVMLDHGTISGKREIYVDGQLVHKSNKTVDTGSEHRIMIGTHPALVQIKVGILGNPKYDLVLDDKSVTTGLPAHSTPPTPGWAWAFVVACALIPVVALGGAIPILIAGVAATACLGMARNPSMSTGMRVAACIGITMLAWVVFALVVGGIALLAFQ